MNSTPTEAPPRAGRWIPKTGPSRLTAAAFGLFMLSGILTINRGYIDFGDGNYLYISWRLSAGAQLYQDILSPQPPMHLLTGKVLIGLGEQLGGGMLTLGLVRFFSLLLHALTAWVVMRIGRVLFEDEWTEALAGAIYLFLPIGLFWSKGYQSEPLEILFLSTAFLGLLKGDRPGVTLAGVCSVLALFTNMTAVPYVALFLVYVLASQRPMAPRFLGIVLGGGGLLLLLFFHRFSGGGYIENVVTNQTGTFHRTDPLGYALHKIVSQGGNVLIAEGGFILCAALGAIVYLIQDGLKPRKVAVWYFFWSLGSIVFVSKGGTEDYIFSIGEPMVAVFGAFFLRFFYLGTFANWMQERSGAPLPRRLTRGAALLTLALVLCFRGGWEILDTLSQGKYENTSEGVERVMGYIERYAEPGDLVWAPAYYAFLNRSRIPEDASESFIWFMRYTNHKYFGDPDPEVSGVIERIVAQLDGEQTPVVVLNLRSGQLGSIDEIRQAVEAHYTLVDNRIRSRNEDLRIYVTRKKVPKLDLRIQ